jgi:hypothetical protein
MTKFGIFRIVGNSLPPRHSVANNIAAVEFILENEPRFADSERVWVLNKFVPGHEKTSIVKILKDKQEKYLDLPFDSSAHFNAFLDSTGLPEERKRATRQDDLQDDPLLQEWIIRHKSQKLVGINEARNVALELGRRESMWTLVLDGGVVFTALGWLSFVEALEGPDVPFAIIPMRRVYSWAEARSLCADEVAGGNYAPVEGFGGEEPQIAFREDTEESFDPRLRYGHKNKAELLSRIGVPGPWDEWKTEEWDRHTPIQSSNRGRFTVAGSVIRLPTDGAGKEVSRERHVNRFRGVVQKSQHVDLEFAISQRNPESEFEIKLPSLMNDRRVELESLAEELLNEQDRFITHKMPRGNFDQHDYCSSAPYITSEGVNVDGELQIIDGDDDPSSQRFDRKSLSRFANRAYALALGGQLLGRSEMLTRSADLIRMWMFNRATRMNPTARHAQRIPGRDAVNAVGIIEFRHLALLPFAIRILDRHGHMKPYEVAAAKTWFSEFLRDSISAGILGNALSRHNNIGTWASVLFCSSALFAGDFGNAFYLARTASIRLGSQLATTSAQPFECERTRPLHYSLFNLSGWNMMCRMAREFSIELSSFRGVNGESLAAAVSYCSENRLRFSEYSTGQEEFDWWMDVLSKKFAPDHKKDIAVTRNLDLGLAQIELV